MILAIDHPLIQRVQPQSDKQLQLFVMLVDRHVITMQGANRLDTGSLQLVELLISRPAQQIQKLKIRSDLHVVHLSGVLGIQFGNQRLFLLTKKQHCQMLIGKAVPGIGVLSGFIQINHGIMLNQHRFSQIAPEDEEAVLMYVFSFFKENAVDKALFEQLGACGISVPLPFKREEQRLIALVDRVFPVAV